MSSIMDHMEKPRISLKPARTASQKPVRRLSVQSLLQNDQMLILEHQGQDYTLRVTRNGKLILTK
jgi:hemin uptake protein HemP